MVNKLFKRSILSHTMLFYTENQLCRFNVVYGIIYGQTLAKIGPRGQFSHTSRTPGTKYKDL